MSESSNSQARERPGGGATGSTVGQPKGARWSVLVSGLRWFVVLPAVVLLGVTAIQIFKPLGRVPPPRPPHLAQAIPSAVPGGWQVRDLPLGPNEFVAEAAQKILRTDDFINREYRRGRVIWGVYAAYWGAGKMPVRLVASHTPDRCWTENGWTCQEMRFKEMTKVGGHLLQPAEWRRFEDDHGRSTYVRFWHLIEGRAFDFGDRFTAVPDPVKWWTDTVKEAMDGSPEQYFIRVTSNVPLEEIDQDPAMQEVLESLARLGLEDTSMAAPSSDRPAGAGRESDVLKSIIKQWVPEYTPHLGEPAAALTPSVRVTTVDASKKVPGRTGPLSGAFGATALDGVSA